MHQGNTIDEMQSHHIGVREILLMKCYHTHSGQGDTIDEMHVHSGSEWEHVHLYTAMSRGRKIKITGSRPDALISPNRDVVEFYNVLMERP